MRGTSASEPLVKHRKPVRRHQSRGFVVDSGMSMVETYLPTMRCPVQRRRDSHFGFHMELENLIGGVKGKGASGGPIRPKVHIHRSGADCPVLVMKRL